MHRLDCDFAEALAAAARGELGNITLMLRPSAAQQAARLVYWLSAWLGVLLLGARAAADSAAPALEAVGAGLMYAAPLAMRVLLE